MADAPTTYTISPDLAKRMEAIVALDEALDKLTTAWLDWAKAANMIGQLPSAWWNLITEARKINRIQENALWAEIAVALKLDLSVENWQYFICTGGVIKKI